MITSGCSGTYQAYYQTLKIAFTQQEDAQLTFTQVEQSDSDVISVKRGERPISIMALAYLENNQHKWVSRDNAMLIMEKGRIVRTLGLSKNLLYVSNTDLDPLKYLPDSQTNNLWTYTSDYTDDEYGYPAASVFNEASHDIVLALGLRIESILYIETMNFQATANYLQLANKWQNYYWYSKSGDLIKSIQKISPLSESLEITYLSRIARLTL